jgi:hypothetical protein
MGSVLVLAALVSALALALVLEPVLDFESSMTTRKACAALPV